MPKLLVVDDSALIRKFVKEIFVADASYVMEFARTGKEALELLHRFQPDAITLDVNMPEMDGLEALSRIMAERPTPVIMLSALTSRDASTSLDALAMGALDCVAKPTGVGALTPGAFAEEVKRKVQIAVISRGRVNQFGTRQTPSPSKATPSPSRSSSSPQVSSPSSNTLSRLHSLTTPPTGSVLSSGSSFLGGTKKPSASSSLSALAGNPAGVVVIGVSTGGPRLLEKLLPSIPGDFPWPIVVIQHMPKKFTEAFANRVDNYCELKVQEVVQATPLAPGNIYIAHGSADSVLIKQNGKICMQAVDEDSAYYWHPSVSVMVKSAMRLFNPNQLIGVMLTGMGNDGAQEMYELKLAGGRTIAESEESCVVFGMPRELIRRGGATVVAHSDDIADQLIKWLVRNTGGLN
jgi:two-component system, chemotaxis family, protein-glutamate methylesterase/glutaminase